MMQFVSIKDEICMEQCFPKGGAAPSAVGVTEIANKAWDMSVNGFIRLFIAVMVTSREENKVPAPF
jgi:hypothetical protein